jgi:hypothetical protein
MFLVLSRQFLAVQPSVSRRSAVSFLRLSRQFLAVQPSCSRRSVGTLSVPPCRRQCWTEYLAVKAEFLTARRQEHDGSTLNT